MQEMARRSNKDRSDTTRAALIAAGRKLFVSRGYAETGTPELVAEAGVTRGALYHHFADKRALFRAVVEAESAAVAHEIESAARPGLLPLKALSKGGAAFLEAMQVPGRTQLLLIDAAAVLGRDQLDAIDARHGGRTLQEGLAAAMQSGALPSLPLTATTQLLSAAYDRAALAIAAGADPGEWHKLIDRVLSGLASPSAAPP
ncbi:MULTISPECIES: TetR/AcrR family transcriptional regulator [unclassified Bosea (in: a-proteobacteria)]|uniref:TetR/AcrR family transcriptional regulator n=1 Tax=unclassified Bosea (in: a-proteobacteria) TaxID=2653178 RepID=UPI000F757420|nr:MULTISPECIES: TetR/AcrR family transcriptional regulator [unclassified Bosea (in: a-proteobacteria)]AZO77410.1 TetR family transcriptional regulator [Bosea sp. Tri-49]RXT22270.1 TetR family transcriptional regulator [Bosea sp. Tri-39]RXT32612.1 TetR family transcriptional regulator [Bosea sp. Tri-54]